MVISIVDQGPGVSSRLIKDEGPSVNTRSVQPLVPADVTFSLSAMQLLSW